MSAFNRAFPQKKGIKLECRSILDSACRKSHHVYQEVALVCKNEKILSEKATYDPFIHHRQHICTGVKKKKKHYYLRGVMDVNRRTKND